MNFYPIGHKTNHKFSNKVPKGNWNYYKKVNMDVRKSDMNFMNINLYNLYRC